MNYINSHRQEPSLLQRWKKWKVKNVKWQNASVFGKQTSSCCVFIYQFPCQNFDQSWSRLSFEGGNRERWQAVSSTRGKAPQIFACILLTSNHIILLVQFGRNHHAQIFQRPQIGKSLKNLLVITYTNYRITLNLAILNRIYYNCQHNQGFLVTDLRKKWDL